MSNLATQLAKLPLSELETLTDEQANELLYDWSIWARPEQMTPGDNWNVWVILAGRGFGKTRTAAEDVKTYGLAYKNSRIAVIAPTFADARDTCIEGESGLLNIIPKNKLAAWNRSIGELYLTNGTKYKLFSADEPERLRGPQHHRAWFDEPCAAKYPSETWDQLMFGLRLKGPLGQSPQAVVTTTPKPIKWLKELIKRNDVVITRGSTFDNAANLSSVALETLRIRYSQSRLGRQELYAEILDDIEGALWKRNQIEDLRVRVHPELKRVVVAIDPAVTANEDSDETGMIVNGLGIDNHGYVLSDCSLRGSPYEWASAAIDAFVKYEADRIVAEVNNGGDMVEHVLRSVAKEKGIKIAYKEVRATRGKQLRAEPISSLYEQGLIHHVGAFPQLEDQMCSWMPGDKSPDRLDANVWGFTELMIGKGASAQDHLDTLKGMMPKKIPAPGGITR